MIHTCLLETTRINDVSLNSYDVESVEDHNSPQILELMKIRSSLLGLTFCVIMISGNNQRERRFLLHNHLQSAMEHPLRRDHHIHSQHPELHELLESSITRNDTLINFICCEGNLSSSGCVMMRFYCRGFFCPLIQEGKIGCIRIYNRQNK